MVKKESAKRGYMTEYEVINHLQDFSNNKEKITYLNKVLQKKDLLSSGTVASVYENLGGLYAQSKRSTEAEEMWEKSKMLREKQNEKGDLTSRLASAFAILGFGASIFFLSSNVTGNVVGNLTQNTSNAIGAVLFCVGLIAGLFYFRGKNK